MIIVLVKCPVKKSSKVNGQWRKILSMDVTRLSVCSLLVIFSSINVWSWIRQVNSVSFVYLSYNRRRPSFSSRNAGHSFSIRVPFVVLFSFATFLLTISPSPFRRSDVFCSATMERQLNLFDMSMCMCAHIDLFLSRLMNIDSTRPSSHVRDHQEEICRERSSPTLSITRWETLRCQGENELNSLKQVSCQWETVPSHPQTIDALHVRHEELHCLDHSAAREQSPWNSDSEWIHVSRDYAK